MLFTLLGVPYISLISYITMKPEQYKKLVISIKVEDLPTKERPLTEAQKAWRFKCAVSPSDPSRWISRKEFVTIRNKRQLTFEEVVDEPLGDRVESWVAEGAYRVFFEHDMYTDEYRVL